MPDTTYTPAGYCPRCGYATDPGRCAECGAELTAAQLDHSPYWLRRRKIIKRMLLIGIPLVLVCALYVGYTSGVLMARIPTPLLLKLQGGKASPITIELSNRLIAGALSTPQANQLLRGFVTVPKDLDIRTPRPASLPFRASFRAFQHIPSPLAESICDSQGQFFVDGQQVVAVNQGSYEYTGIEYRYQLPAIPTGEHEIRFTGTIVLLVNVSGTGTPAGSLSIPVTLMRKVTFENYPLSHYVTFDESPNIKNQVLRTIHAEIKLHPGKDGVGKQYGKLTVLWNPLPMDGAWSVWIRSPLHPAFEKVYELTTASTSGVHMPLREAPDLSMDTQVDVRLVPDLKLAFDSGFDHCLGGVIEWSGLPLVKTKGAGIFDAGRPPDSYPGPTRILPGITATAPATQSQPE